MERKLDIEKIVFNRYSYWLCPFILLLSFISSGKGMGIKMCYFKYLTDLPCPGCGLTRSISNISRLRFYEAWLYHPFGFFLYFFCCFIIIYLVLPDACKMKIRRFFKDNGVLLSKIYLWFVYSFILYGLCRMLSYPFFKSMAL